MKTLELRSAEAPATVTAMVTGLFWSRDDAERAFHAVISHGYGEAEISVVMSGHTRERCFRVEEAESTELATKAQDKRDLGGPFGATLGTIAAAVGSAGTLLLLPGLGVIVAGPIAAAVAGATAVAIASGFVVALHNWGIPADRIREYESGIKRGGILMGVTPHCADDAAYIAQQWQASHADHVSC